MSAGKGDDGLVGGFVPLDGGLGFGTKLLPRHQGVKDADPVEIKSVLVGGEMLEEGFQGLTGGEGPKLLFPGRHPGADLGIGRKGVLEAGPDMTPVDAGDPGGVGILGSFREGVGKEAFRRIGGGRLASFHRILKSSTENGQNGERSVGKKEIPQGLQPNHHEFDRVLPLESPGFLSERKGKTAGDFGKEVGIGFDLTERGLKAGGQAGQFAGATMAHAQNDDAGGEPVPVTPMGVGFGIEVEVHPEIDMGNDGATEILGTRLGSFYFFEGFSKVGQSLTGIRGIAGAGTTCRQRGGGECQAFGKRASTAFQSTKFRNSSM